MAVASFPKLHKFQRPYIYIFSCLLTYLKYTLLQKAMHPNPQAMTSEIDLAMKARKMEFIILKLLANN